MRVCPRCREEIAREDPRVPFAIAIPEYAPELSEWLVKQECLKTTRLIPLYAEWIRLFGTCSALILWTYVAASHSAGGGNVALSLHDIGDAMERTFSKNTILKNRARLIKAGILILRKHLTCNVQEYQVNWVGLAEICGGAK